MSVVGVVLLVLLGLLVAGIVGVVVLGVIRTVGVGRRRRQRLVERARLEVELQRLTHEAMRQMLLQARFSEELRPSTGTVVISTPTNASDSEEAGVWDV